MRLPERGFTLIEVMVVAIIVAVIASIAYPSYQQYLTKSKRAAAESFLLSAASKEEQILLDLRCYVSVANNADFPNAPTAAPPGLNLAVPADVSAHYNIDIVGACPAGAPPGYAITATPASPAQMNDTKCANLTLDQTGAKGISGTGTVEECW